MSLYDRKPSVSKRRFLSALCSWPVLRWLVPAGLLGWWFWPPDHRWERFKGQGLADKDESLEDMIIFEDGSGYGCGWRYDDGKVGTSAALFRTPDFGRHWSRIPLPPGFVNVVSVHPFGPVITLLALKDESSRSSYILQSHDSGGTWREILEPGSGMPAYSSRLHADASGNCLLTYWHRDEADGLISRLFLRKTGNNAWEQVLKRPGGDMYMFRACSDGALIFEARQNLGPGLCDYAAIFTLKDGHIRDYRLPSPLWLDDALYDGKTWHFCGHNKYARAYYGRLGPEGLWLRLMGLSCRPNRLYVSGDTVCSIVVPDKGVSILGATHKLLLSRDRGESWRKFSFEFSLITKPACLIGEKTFLASAMPGKFQELTLKD